MTALMRRLDTKETSSEDPVVLPGLVTKGDRIAGRYRVEKLLGVGSSGFVVSARHVYSRRRVTLKIFSADASARPMSRGRHLVAAQVVSKLQGPHVARIVDTGFTEQGIAFIASEALDGRTLAEELGVRARLPVIDSVRWVMQACEGLAEAHGAGIVHGDLKPQNLFLATCGGDVPVSSGADVDGRVLKILDFGMVRPWGDEDDASSTAWFGSPAYVAPEQLRDPQNTSARADVWALGVMIHHLISGELPFNARTVSGMFVAVMQDEPSLLQASDVPIELARVVHGCLAKDPDERTPDVATLAQMLAPFAGSGGEDSARRVAAILASQTSTTIESEPNASTSAPVEADAASGALAPSDAVLAVPALAVPVLAVPALAVPALAVPVERPNIARRSPRAMLMVMGAMMAVAVFARSTCVDSSAVERHDARNEAVGDEVLPLVSSPLDGAVREPDRAERHAGGNPAPNSRATTHRASRNETLAPLPFAAEPRPMMPSQTDGARSSLSVRENPYQVPRRPRSLNGRRK